MNLWLVLYAGTQIAGTWGPLPYDMAECETRRDERRASVSEMIRTGVGENGLPIPDAIREKLKTWRLECEEHPFRPELGKDA